MFNFYGTERFLTICVYRRLEEDLNVMPGGAGEGGGGGAETTAPLPSSNPGNISVSAFAHRWV